MGASYRTTRRVATAYPEAEALSLGNDGVCVAVELFDLHGAASRPQARAAWRHRSRLGLSTLTGTLWAAYTGNRHVERSMLVTYSSMYITNIAWEVRYVRDPDRHR